jgi:tetratricopeptide (TPR) repeat protein
MAETRIDDLRRRVQKDPASIAFAQLAEECRRAGAYDEAVAVARAGLAIHPGYLSARVTLGRALIEINQLDEAQSELELVLKSASENLAAIRGMAEIHHRRGHLEEALVQYRTALALARNDPDLEQTVADLARQIEPAPPKPGAGGLTLEQVTQELSFHRPPTSAPVPADAAEPAGQERVSKTVAALEEWLAAIHVARTDSGA